MPTYEYACRSCDTHLEVVQRFDDEPLTQCHACGGSLRKVFGNIGIAFKGSGFYKTDSRSLGKAGSKAAGDAGKDTSGGGDAAPATDGGSSAAKDGTAGTTKESKPASTPATKSA